MASEAPKVSLEDQLACVAREIRMRERVYPDWVARGRMTKKKADQELLHMNAVHATLEGLAKEGRLL